jgi:hypothetical protein
MFKLQLPSYLVHFLKITSFESEKQLNLSLRYSLKRKRPPKNNSSPEN